MNQKIRTHFAFVAFSALFYSFSILAFEEEDGTSGKKKKIETPATPIESVDVALPRPEGKSVKIDDSTTMVLPPEVKTAMQNRSSKHSDLGLGVQGEIGSSSGPFYARVTLSQKYNRYVLWDGGGFFGNNDNSQYKSMFYALETGPRLILINPTIFYPFVGAGMGYEVWKQENLNSDRKDNSSSLTFSYFGGLIANMTKNFGLTLTQRFKNYINNRPYSIADNKRQKNPSSSVDVGFVVMF
jgi:hypothetical protein